MANTQTKQKAFGKMGRLETLGITEEYMLPLYIPAGYEDYTNPHDGFPPERDVNMLCRVKMASEVKTYGVKNSFTLADKSGEKRNAIMYGNISYAENLIEFDNFGYAILKTEMNGFLGRQIVIKKFINNNAIGKIYPKYKSKKGYIAEESIRSKIVAHINSGGLDLTIRFIMDSLSIFNEAEIEKLIHSKKKLRDLIRDIHQPLDFQQIETDHAAFSRLDALLVASKIYSGKRERANGFIPQRIPLKQDIESRIDNIHFDLTDCQLRCIEEIKVNMAQERMHRLLTGDVGSGKSAVYGVIAASLYDTGGTSAILMPSTILATQIYDEFKRWWLDIPLHLVKSGKKVKPEDQNGILIGTTALLHANLLHKDLLVVDEQQQFSLDQREKLSFTHLLEVSATCIPRTQAIAALGIMDSSRLEKGHVKNAIKTKIYKKDSREALFKKCLETIEQGHQVAIVYPAKETNPEAKKLTLKSATEAFEQWRRHLGDKVRLLHGDTPATEKVVILNDMVEKRAQLLIATTVIEVGITIPGLMGLLVVNAERFGLNTLHQLRGRLARHGGDAWMGLYLPDSVSDEVIDRLSILEKSRDGFKVAEHNLKIKGCGELDGKKQHGKGFSLIVNAPTETDLIPEILDEIQMLEFLRAENQRNIQKFG